METHVIHPLSANAILPPYGTCCAGAGPFGGPAAAWLLASHEAVHDPTSIVFLPRRAVTSDAFDAPPQWEVAERRYLSEESMALIDQMEANAFTRERVPLAITA